MVDTPQGFLAAFLDQDRAVIERGNNPNPNTNPNINALPMGFQDQPIRDQMILYSQNAILEREFNKLRASVENSAATNL